MKSVLPAAAGVEAAAAGVGEAAAGVEAAAAGVEAAGAGAGAGAGATGAAAGAGGATPVMLIVFLHDASICDPWKLALRKSCTHCAMFGHCLPGV